MTFYNCPCARCIHKDVLSYENPCEKCMTSEKHYPAFEQDKSIFHMEKFTL
jgi:hypothetical protein